MVEQLDGRSRHRRPGSGGRWRAIVNGMNDLFAQTPALARLRWLLDGLGGRWPAQTDVEGALAPDFADRVAPGMFLDLTRDRAARFAPIRVVGVDADRSAATARFLSREQVDTVQPLDTCVAAVLDRVEGATFAS